MDDDKKQDIPSYVKLPYPQVNKENKKTKKGTWEIQEIYRYC